MYWRYNRGYGGSASRSRQRPKGTCCSELRSQVHAVPACVPPTRARCRVPGWSMVNLLALGPSSATCGPLLRVAPPAKQSRRRIMVRPPLITWARQPRTLLFVAVGVRATNQDGGFSLLHAPSKTLNWSYDVFAGQKCISLLGPFCLNRQKLARQLGRHTVRIVKNNLCIRRF